MTAKRAYRPSAKRAATSAANRTAIKEAGWRIFAEKGLDGATVAQIVSSSGVSTGSFYNYFGSCTVLFNEILADIVGEIRAHTQIVRAASDDLEAMLYHSYKALLDFILSTEGATAFCMRNQPHIRARLFALENTSNVLDDVRADLIRVVPTAHFSDWELALISGLIFANGLEALLQTRDLPEIDTESLARMMTRLMVSGIEGFRTAGA